jgi:hypothetical protein
MLVLLILFGSVVGLTTGYIVGSQLALRWATKIVGEIVTTDEERGYDENYWWNYGKKPDEIEEM